ncbi:MAG: DNA starvation/stationary phase protection protein Dps [Alphaproteobacteria bacterium]|nr:DNA starvation/stationary phase protection protein Dps [Alphaproteobacteria bacterium]
MKLHQTLNNEQQKEKSIVVLNQFVTDFLCLALATKQAHWNMRGSNFISVHEMLDPFNEKLLEYVDLFAERAVQLGGTALGTAQEIVKVTKLSPYPTDIYATTQHLILLQQQYGEVANAVRQVVENGEADADTIDILTGASEDLDKFLWFIEAHLSEE